VSHMPSNNWNNRFGGFPPQGPWPPRRRRPRVRWKLRLVWIILPLLILAVVAIVSLLSSVDFDFDLDLGWDMSPEFAGLLVFGLVLILIVGILRILRGKR